MIDGLRVIIKLSQIEISIAEWAANFALEHKRVPYPFEVEIGMSTIAVAKKQLTWKEQRIFDFVEKRIKAGQPPTRKEAGGAVGVNESTARQYLKKIERKGWIRLIIGQHRGIELI